MDDSTPQDEQSPATGSGRASNGTFAAGNRISKGNPYAKRVSELRQALFDAVNPKDMKQVVAALVKQAKTGDVVSIRELFQRLLGPPESIDLLERLEQMEAKINELVDAGKSGARR